MLPKLTNFPFCSCASSALLRSYEICPQCEALIAFPPALDQFPCPACGGVVTNHHRTLEQSISILRRLLANPDAKTEPANGGPGPAANPAPSDTSPENPP